MVLAMTPLPWPPSKYAMRPTMGTMLPWTVRAFLDGETFVGLRTEDMLVAVQWLAAQDFVDAVRISAYADGASGIVLLHASVLEPRIRQITSSGRSAPGLPSWRRTCIAMLPSRLFQACCCTTISTI